MRWLALDHCGSKGSYAKSLEASVVPPVYKGSPVALSIFLGH